MRDLESEPEVGAVYRVSDLVGDLRAVCAEAFGRVWVEGEVSELHRSRPGHLYFALKDDAAVLRAVLFRSAAARSEVELEEGAYVRVRAQLDVYPERGQLQLVVDRVVPAGEGALRVAFERLKQRLQAEGVFDAAHKRPLPAAPCRIGLITSIGGAALHDFLRALRRRGAHLDIVVYDARVQGEQAWREIVRGLHRLGSVPGIEVVVLARGGGSLQDLWTFNREELVRAIFECETPVISAIGHETDWVLTDGVADARAATPTAAAELVCPDAAHLRRVIEGLATRLVRAQGGRVASLAQHLRGLERGLIHPRQRLAAARQRLDGLRALLMRRSDRGLSARRDRWILALRRLEGALERPVAPRRERLERSRAGLGAGVDRARERASTRLGALGARLDALSPLGVLARGYSIARRQADGVILRSSQDVEAGASLAITLADGEVRASVTATVGSQRTGGSGDRGSSDPGDRAPGDRGVGSR